MADRVEYEPVAVKAVLAEMKDTAELLVDLAYSAVLLDDPEVAREVLELEERMDLLQLRARMSLLVAARSPADAEALAPVLGVVGAAEKISDAAGDIAKVVLSEDPLPAALRGALPAGVATLVRAAVAADAPLTDRTLGEAALEAETGVRVLAVRREDEWLLDPDGDTRLRAGDVALLRGPETGVETVYPRVTGEAYKPPAPAEPSVADLDRAVETIVLMKDTAELAVDLAYGAVLFDSRPVAEEVFELEAEVDALKARFEAWVLRAAAEVEEPASLRGLVQLAGAVEVVSDAALEISEGVLRGIGTHPVVAEAVEESDEVVVRRTVGEGAGLAGATLGERTVETDTGMRVVAVRRGDGGADDREAWVRSPGPETRLRPGDVVLATGPRGGVERLEALL